MKVLATAILQAATVWALARDAPVEIPKGEIPKKAVCALCEAVGPARPGSLERPVVSWSGPNRKVARPEYLRVTVEKNWIRLWERHTGRKQEYLVPHYPVIDFSRFMVVAVFAGSATNSDVILGEILPGDPIRIRISRLWYQTGTNPPRRNPFGIFLIPRSSRAIVFEEDERRLKSAPAHWVQRARIPEVR